MEEIVKNFTDVLKKWNDFGSRARRREYWMFVLINSVISFLLSLIGGLVLPEAYKGIPSGLFDLAILVPAIAVGVRRLHDTDRSGWWLLLVFTLIGIFPLIYFLASDSTKGSNQFGASPKYPV
jgi:uncharacterized membrane protein YhaH (DUF805 family)